MVLAGILQAIAYHGGILQTIIIISTRDISDYEKFVLLPYESITITGMVLFFHW